MTNLSNPPELEITTEKSRIDLGFVHSYLSEVSYRAKGIPRERVATAIQHSLCFSVFSGEEQIGFARVVSDEATFAYLCDVFVAPEQQGRGVGKALMAHIMAYPNLQHLRRWMLMTRDAHGLYETFGFSPLKYPDRAMEIARPDIYQKLSIDE